MMLPGTRALAFASRWLDAPTVATVFDPLVADWQREWLDAAPSRRQAIYTRGLAAFCSALIVSSPELWRPVPLAFRLVTRTGAYMLVATVAGSLLVLMKLDAPWSSAMLLYLMASIFAFALPFSAMVGTDLIRAHDELPMQVQRRTALQVAAYTLLLMVFMVLWVLPETRSHWQTVDPSSFDAIAGLRYETSGNLLRMSRTRAAMAVLPPILIWMRWRALNQTPPRGPKVTTLFPQPEAAPRPSPMPLSLALTLAIAGYLTLSFAGNLAELWWRFPAGTGGVLPLLAFAMAGYSNGWWSFLRIRRRGRTA